jgi:hypothetical protein
MSEEVNEITITPETLCKAAKAGVTVLNSEGTTIPGNLRFDISILEAVLTAIAEGRLVVGTPVDA